MSPDDPSLKSELIRLTREHWAETRTALLLSSAGTRLSNAGFHPREKLPFTTLSEFVREEMSSELTLLQDPNNELVYGLVPAGVEVEVEEEVATYFARPRRTTKTRLPSALWAAFVKPIEPGLSRVVLLDPRLRFVDTEDPPPDALTVPPELIAPDGSAPDHDSVIATAKAWATRNEVSLAELSARPRLASRDTRNTVSVMDALVSTLDSHELERISMPLDVVAHLMRTELKRL